MSELREVVPLAAKRDETAEGMVIAVVVANRAGSRPQPGDRMVIYERSPPSGSLHSDLDVLIVEAAATVLEHKSPAMRSFRFGPPPGTAPLQDGDVDIFLEPLSRPPRLVIVGAGHIAVPLARIAAIAEFDVVIVDDRAEFATQDRFPDAHHILVGPYAERLATIRVDSDTYVVLVTRGHVHDQACLELLLESPAAYIGMIGSRRRVRTVAQQAAEAGHDPERLRRLYAPIGIDIGARTPAEIAVAIMAEIINLRRDGHAPSLALKERLRV